MSFVYVGSVERLGPNTRSVIGEIISTYGRMTVLIVTINEKLHFTDTLDIISTGKKFDYKLNICGIVSITLHRIVDVGYNTIDKFKLLNDFISKI